MLDASSPGHVGNSYGKDPSRRSLVTLRRTIRANRDVENPWSGLIDS